LGLDANYKTYYASGDTYLAKYKSGLGFQVLHDIQGSSVYSSTQFSFIYSYEIPVSKTFTARLGLQASGIQRTLNYNGLRFPGQFDDPNGFVGGPTNQPTGIQNQLYADIGAGTLVYSDRMWGGFSVEHLNTPVQSFAGATKDNLPMNFQLTGGYKIPLSQRKYLAYTEDKSEISITPTFHYKSQGKSDQLDIGLYGMYNQLMAGVWYRGIPIKHYDLLSLRSQTGVVPQDVFLFSDTIFNNIAFGLKSPDETKVFQAAKDADVYTNITSFPLGFNTRVGERGITLSGGQKQRVSIARAVVREPKILILDDALSAVDTKTENTILNSMRKIMQGRTSIIISHRVSSAKLANKIIVLHDGMIIEEGTHESLLALNGAYRELYDKQMQVDEVIE